MRLGGRAARAAAQIGCVDTYAVICEAGDEWDQRVHPLAGSVGLPLETGVVAPIRA
jgi:hypothetical protein